MHAILPLLLQTALAADPNPAQGEDPPSRKGGWFASIRYGVGFAISAGATLDDPDDLHVIAEPFAFELRSFLAKRFAWHTTLNVGRMVAPALSSGDGRLDYDLHLAGHVPLTPTTEVVVAPGAGIAYSFGNSGYQRFVGDARLGVDLIARDGLWVTGVYLRPFAGWAREVGATRGHVTGGVLLEVAGIAMIPKREDRSR